MSTPADPAARPAPALGRPALGGLALATGLVPLSSTMVAVALVAVEADLGVGAAAATWLVTAYLAAMALVQPLGGRVGDRLGHARAFRWGLALFLALSALAALAPAFAVLVALRVGQAAAGGLMLPNAGAMIRDRTDQGGRGRALGVLAAALALAAALGPVVGGLVGGTLGWRALFLIPVPIGLVAAPLLPRPDPARHRTTAPAPPHAAQALLQRRPFALASLTVLLHNGVLYLALLVVPVLAHDRLGLGHGASGVLMAALTLGLLGGALAGGRLADRAGRRAGALTGALLAVAGAAPLAVAAAHPALPALAALLVVTGAGIGLAGPGLQAAALDAAPPGAAAVAAGWQMSARYAGGIAASLLAGALIGQAALTAALVVAAGAAALAVLTATGLPAGAPWRLAPA
jgi:MFS family permease